MARRIPNYVDTDPAPELLRILDEFTTPTRDYEDALRDLRDKVRAGGLAVGPVLSSGSSVPRGVEDRFAETKNILDFGASTGAADNAAAIQGAIDAAFVEGGGTALIPSGVFRFVSRVNMRTGVSIVGYGRKSVLFYDPASSGSAADRFGLAWEGSWLDFPTRKPLGDEHPLTLLPIAAASAGSVELVAGAAGSLDALSAGDWILVCEGPAPKWNNRLQFVRVAGRAGDVVTLDRPLDFSFDGTSGPGVSFGVARIRPVEDAWVSSVALRTGQYAVFGAFGTGLAVRGGVRDCLIDPLFDGSNPFLNSAHAFEVRDCLFSRGQIGGFNRSSYCRLFGNTMPNIGNADQEYGEGASFNLIAFNLFAGHTGLNPLIGVGGGSYVDISHNVFSNVANSSAIKVANGAERGTICNNKFHNVREFAISIGTIDGYDNGKVVKHWTVSGNIVSLKSSLALDAAFPAIAVHEYPNVEEVSIVDNWVSHSIKIGTGQQYDDQRSIYVVNNRGPGVTDGIEPTRIRLGRSALSVAYRESPVDAFWSGRVAGKSWDAGELVYKWDANLIGSQGFYITEGGTTGTALAGVTGSIASGSDVLTVNDATRLLPGSYIIIAGVSGTRKIKSKAGNVITLTSTSNATVVGAAVAWAAPKWTKLPSMAAARVDSSATDVAGVVADFNDLLAKLRSAGVLT